MPGDCNGDGSVDGVDLAAWHAQLASPGAGHVGRRMLTATSTGRIYWSGNEIWGVGVFERRFEADPVPENRCRDRRAATAAAAESVQWASSRDQKSS